MRTAQALATAQAENAAYLGAPDNGGVPQAALKAVRPSLNAIRRSRPPHTSSRTAQCHRTCSRTPYELRSGVLLRIILNRPTADLHFRKGGGAATYVGTPAGATLKLVGKENKRERHRTAPTLGARMLDTTDFAVPLQHLSHGVPLPQEWTYMPPLYSGV